KSQVVGTDVKSFVISHVPEGSVVEKWDAATEQWVDVSTMPTSSNPQELMRLLSNRYIKEGDTIQWRPKAGAGAAAQQAFEMIGWDDGSELPGVSAEAPSVVQNLAVAPTGVGELTVSWDPPATGDATSYSITMTTEAGSGNSSTTYVTSDTDYTFTGLSPANGYSFSVTASNAEGTSSAAQDSFGQAPIAVGKGPWGLTTGLDGSIWVANDNLATVQQIVNDNGVWTPQATIGVGMGPTVLTTGLDGSIWVVNQTDNTVQQIVNDNGVWTAQAAIDVGKNPHALTTGLDGSIWLANYGSNTVQQIAVPPNAPFALAAVFGPELGPEPSQMTLAWRRPVIDGDSPVISYTATVAQGEYFQTITTTDLSCVFDGLTLGSGPTYFTVTATNFAGVGSTATHQVDASGNTIPQQRHTGVGITT
ncbi:MAG: fibronectin type III domain-containing protein, partial [Pontimonas sp.]